MAGSHKKTMNQILENPPRVADVRVTETSLGYVLEDGREIIVPIGYYPSLALATKTERECFKIYPVSVHWPKLDVDISSEALLLGAKERPAFAARAVKRAQRRNKTQKAA